MARKIAEKLKLHNEELNRLTIESITQALLLLIQTNEYEKISITDICKKAGVSRNAFYHNFKSKEAVLKSIIFTFNKDVLLRELGNPFRGKTELSWYVNFFTTIMQNENLFTVLIKSNLTGFYLDYVNHILTVGSKMDDATQYKRILWNGAIQNIALEWLKRGKIQTPQQMGEICFNILSKSE